VASPVPVQERLRGWWRGNFSFGLRPYACSRVGLTKGRRMHIGGCGCKTLDFHRKPESLYLVIVPGSVAIMYRMSHRIIHKVIHRIT
jgi:hypothetical protein